MRAVDSASEIDFEVANRDTAFLMDTIAEAPTRSLRVSGKSVGADEEKETFLQPSEGRKALEGKNPQALEMYFS